MKAAITGMALALIAVGTQAQVSQTPPAQTQAIPKPVPSVQKAITTLKPEDQKKFEASVKAAGFNPPDLKGMDLETAMMAVQTNRANMLEAQLKDQLAVVQQRNDKLAKLNNALTNLNKAAASFPADAKSDTKVGTTSFKNNDYAMEKEINSALDAAGVRPFTKNGTDDTSARGRLKTNAFYDGGIGGGSTKAQIDAAIQKIKAEIDSTSNSQQMDMLRLQSLSNKRNEAFDTMTNFIKKMQQNRSSIVGNMR